MKAILYHPPLHENLNDGLIVEGVSRLLARRGLDAVICVYGSPRPDGDLLIVCGTPWLWHDCGRSYKLAALARTLEGFDGPAIALGIGSSFCGPPAVQKRDVDLWRRFAAVIVRDPAAEKLLMTHGIACRRAACPALLAEALEVAPTVETLLVGPAEPGVEADAAVAMTQDEADAMYRAGHRAVELVGDLETLKRRILQARRVMSRRVHTCLYAWGRRQVVPLATDSRMETVTCLGEREAEENYLRKVFDESLDPHLG